MRLLFFLTVLKQLILIVWFPPVLMYTFGIFFLLNNRQYGECLNIYEYNEAVDLHKVIYTA